MKINVIDCIEDGSDKEKECKEEISINNQLVKGLRDDAEQACAMHEKLKEDSICTESMREVLVENLKIELCRIMRKSQEEYHLDFEEMKNKIEKEFVLDIKEEKFEGRETCFKGSETKAKLKEFEEKENNSDKLEDSMEYEKSKEDFDCDNEDFLCRMFDG